MDDLTSRAGRATTARWSGDCAVRRLDGSAASHEPHKLLRVERRESPPPSPMVAHRVAPLHATLVEGWPMRRWDAAARDGRSSCTWMRDVVLRFVRWCAAAAASFSLVAAPTSPAAALASLRRCHDGWSDFF
ncbi:hypothetical protein F511_46940 [Dorcoceras hygrometricum]|uniref:Uncharacterized protein n=1 Tax=Dorcoceras hygrometricum TaxID=472368 RepID=A0A2Z6ZSB9_9LAMI|nr:hypothetical protein F511_46940 [Dorcoceras hygrometricum]